MKSVFNIYSLCLAIMVVLGLTSCKREATRQLQYVQGIIQERPDTALTILQNLPAESLKASSQKAQYSLLYAKALDKNYIDTTDVSIIEPAVEYYSRHKRDDRYAEALFYKGRICQNGGDNQTAITYFNEALDEVSEDNHILLDLIHTYIAESYNISSNPVEELIHRQSAYEESLKSGIDANIRSDMFFLAKANRSCCFFSVSDSLLNVLVQCPDTEDEILTYSKLLIAKNCMEKNPPDYTGAVEGFSYAVTHGAVLCPEEILEYQYALLQVTNKEDILISEVIPTESGLDHQYYYWMSRIAYHKAQYKEAADAMTKFEQNSRHFTNEALMQSLLRSEEQFHIKKAEDLYIKNERSHLILAIYLLTSLAVILLLTITLICFRYKMTMRTNQLEAALSATRELMAMNMTKADDVLRRTKQELCSSYRKRLIDLEQYCIAASKSYQYKLKDSVTLNPSKEIKELVDAIFSVEENQERLAELIDADLGGIIHNLKEDYNKILTNEEVILFCYMVLGLSNKTMAFLFDVQDATIRSRKFRLKSKIQSIDCTNRPLYESFW